MKVSNQCPCCNGSLLHHIRKGGSYWFCSNCWQEMPSSLPDKLITSTSKNPVSKILTNSPG